MNARPRHQNKFARWLPVAAAGGLLAAVLVAGAITGGSSGGGGGAASVPAITNSITDAAPLVTDPIVTISPENQVETEVVATKVALDRLLGDGVAGDDVARVQQRLHELAFDPGPVDGIYGLMTKQAVWAFEKLVMGVSREDATGKVTPELWDRMQDSITIKPRRPTAGLANHTEVYLPEQVLIVFNADVPVLVSHISTGQLDQNGEPREYCETATYDTDEYGQTLDPPVTKAVCAESKTPGGVFTYSRMVQGKRVSPLGGMYDPVYFNYGIAVHGALEVPNKPQSHGCVRLPLHISEDFQSLIRIGERILVWNGEKEPEDVTERESLPSFDRPDPNATTTTTSTTTTTTVAPETTVPPPVTQAPPPATITTTSTSTSVAPTTTQAPSTTVKPSDGL